MTVTILHGPPQSGKTTEARRRYVERVRSDGWSSAVCILPTADSVREERLRICEDLGGAAVTSLVTTFPQLAERVLVESESSFTRITSPLDELIASDAVRRSAERSKSDYLQRASTMPGFVKAVVAAIGEFKRAALDETRARDIFRKAGITDRRTGEILEIYRLYQDVLKAKNLYDDEGAFWWAVELLRRGKPGPLADVRLTVIDGFTDFTPIQLVLMEELSRLSEEMFVTIPDGPAGEETIGDLWREELRTLRGRFPDAALIHHNLREVGQSSGGKTPPGDDIGGNVPSDPPEASTEGDETAEPPVPEPLAPQLRHALTHLFAIEKEKLPEPGNAIRIITTPGPIRMLDEIACECKRLIVREGIEPHEIGIVFRSLENVRTIVEAFSRVGVPVQCGKGRLSDCPSVNTALRLLRLVTDDFPRSDVVGLLRSGYVDDRIDDRGLRGTDRLDHIARAAGIVGGRDPWLQNLENLADQLERFQRAEELGLSKEETDELRGALPTHLTPEEVRDTRAYMVSFFKLFDALQHEGNRAGMVGAYQELLDDFLIGDRLLSRQALQASARDVQGYLQFLRLLDDLAAASTEVAGEKIDLPEFVREVESMVGDTAWDHMSGRPGGVRITGVLGARQMHFRVVFIAGLVEQSFPAKHREGLFFRDREREKLADSGIFLPTRHRSQLGEARLFYESLSRGTERVYLVQPIEDIQGRETVVSHFTEEVIDAFDRSPEEQRVPVSELTPEVTEAYNPSALIESVMMRIWGMGVGGIEARSQLPPDGKDDDLEGALAWLLGEAGERGNERPWREVLVKVVHGGTVERARLMSSPGPYDGFLAGAPTGKELGRVFHEEREYSPSQFEEYGRCPFTYFCKHLLGLRPLEEPAYEMNPRVRGSIYHEILRRYHAGAGDNGQDVAKGSREEKLTRIIDEVFEWYDRMGVAGYRGIWRTERRRCRQDLILWLDVEQDLAAAGYRPVLFEEAFGTGRQSSPAIDIGGEEVPIRGRIDRADYVGDGGYALFDYKTGRAPSGPDMEYGRALQLPVYDLALGCHPDMGERRPVLWGYYLVRNRPLGIDRNTVITDPKKMDEKRRGLRAYVRRRVRWMRRGRFVPAWWMNACRFCDYKEACRHDSDALVKKWHMFRRMR